MLLYLQITFIILSAICVGALLPVGTYLGWTWAGACILLAVLFFGLTLLCKQARTARGETDEESSNETQNENDEK
jgi:membrane protein implicated in regulation of membrane protease activity